MVWHNTRPRTRHQRAPAAFIDPCLPTKVNKPPAGDGWAHEIKHDGYRLQIHVDRGDVRLFTMTGYDWTDRYPGIVAAAAKVKGSAILDAEAVVLGADGVPDFEALHSRARDAAAVAFVFDVMVLDGKDLRPLPWIERRAKLRRLLGRRKLGLTLSQDLVGDGPAAMPRPAAWGWRASYQSGWMRRTARARSGHGSRSKIQLRPVRCGFVRLEQTLNKLERDQDWAKVAGGRPCPHHCRVARTWHHHPAGDRCGIERPQDTNRDRRQVVSNSS